MTERTITCGNCGQGIDVARFEPGRRIHCPMCGWRLTVPEHAGPASSPAPAAGSGPEAAGLWLGVSAIITGGIGLLIGLVPICGCGGMPLSAIAVVLGILAVILSVIQSNRGMAFAAVGLVVGLIALITPIISTGSFLGNLAEPFDWSVQTEEDDDSGIEAVAAGLEAYRSDVGGYPTTARGLEALLRDPGVKRWDGPYLDSTSDLNDRWGRPFRYRASAGRRPDSFHLSSAGPDGVRDTHDDIIRTTQAGL